MLREIATLGSTGQTFLTVVVVIMAVFCLICLIKIIVGPSAADRLLAANMMGGIINVMICLLYVLLREEFLLDVALVYAMLSFLAVIALSNIYIGVYRQKHLREEAAEHE